MSDIIIFFLIFYILLVSVVGYGILFQNLCFGKMKGMADQSTIYIGFYGLFLLTLISLLSSLLVPHNFAHNIILHLIGVLLFIFLKIKNKKDYSKIIFFISLFTLSALLISKTHDDFSYYHLPFTKYLTEQKIIFGMGNLGHGYKLISSLFFLNSTFYLPVIEYFSFHFSLLFFLIFFNYILLKEIISEKNHEVIKFLCIFALTFFNLSFNRIAEYGTDKAGQLLIVVLIIKIFQHICFDNNKFKLNGILILLPLLAFCISLKTYFLSYILLGATIVLLDTRLSKSIKTICNSRSFFIFLFSLSIYFFHHFISTGCFISPLSITCFGDNLDWASNSIKYKDLAIWLEQWAKAGAGPGFRVQDPLEYIKNFNWISHWVEKYFMGKFLDQLGVLISVFLAIFLFLKNLKLTNGSLTLDKKIIFFYLIILTIFFIWFSKHPSLRYGGYSIVFLTFSIPIAIIFQKTTNKKFFKRNFKYLVLLIVVIFNLKNINRINKEFQRTDLYKFDNFPYFAIPEKKFIPEKTLSGLTFYRTTGHCWNTPTPCTGSLKSKIGVKKINGYYFLIKNPTF
jgi:hypothetical protein